MYFPRCSRSAVASTLMEEAGFVAGFFENDGGISPPTDNHDDRDDNVKQNLHHYRSPSYQVLPHYA
ncbi:MAG: hypothetical protein QM757_01560 [Paludibaculum sp.]